MHLLCLVPELAAAGVTPLSPWDEESWAPPALPIAAKLHQPPHAMAARPPHTHTSHPFMPGVWKIQGTAVRTAGCAWGHQVSTMDNSILEDLMWLSMPRATDSSRAEKISCTLPPTLKRVSKHPPATPCTAALFHGKFCLALIR